MFVPFQGSNQYFGNIREALQMASMTCIGMSKFKCSSDFFFTCI